MRDCEDRYEVLISSWLDAELSREEGVELLDHLAGCAACRGFYRDARQLDTLLAQARPLDETLAPHDALWRRIASAAARPAPARRTRGVRRAWLVAVPLAAALALAALLGWLVSSTDRAGAAGQTVGAQLASRPEPMSDERFVTLLRELLQSEPRYQQAMLQVMSQVVEETGSAEMASEGVLRHDDRGLARAVERREPV
jgi:predicted anti-sigma-YlaC factor YlaD